MVYGIALPKGQEALFRAAYRAYARANAAGKREARVATGHHLAAIAANGHSAGWPWRLLAEPCGISAERLRQITNDYGADAAMESVPSIPPYQPMLAAAREAVAPSPRRRQQRGTLTQQERTDLVESARLARFTTGSVALDDPRRLASEKLSRTILDARKRAVTWREMAELTGYTQVGLRMRAARHGGTPPPSVAPYRGVTIHPRTQDPSDAS